MVPGLSRRDILRIGSIGAGGLALPELLRAEKLQKIGSSNKSVIMVYMAGAPPHQDLIDPKPDAPKEVRSAFEPIRTNVTGIHLNESLPMLAKVMNKWTGIRTMVGAPSGSHDSFMCYTGRPGSAFSTVLIPSHRAIGPAWALPCLSWRARAGGACLLSLALLPRRSSALWFAWRAWFSGNRPWSVSSDRSVFGRHEAGLRSGSHRPQAISFGRIRFFPQILEQRERTGANGFLYAGSLWCSRFIQISRGFGLGKRRSPGSRKIWQRGSQKRRGRGSTQQRTLPDCPQVGGGRGPHGDPQFRALGLSFQQHGGGPRARSRIRPGVERFDRGSSRPGHG